MGTGNAFDWLEDAMFPRIHQLPGKRICPTCDQHTEDLVCDETGMVHYDEFGATGKPFRCPLFRKSTSSKDTK